MENQIESQNNFQNQTPPKPKKRILKTIAIIFSVFILLLIIYLALVVFYQTRRDITQYKDEYAPTPTPSPKQYKLNRENLVGAWFEGPESSGFTKGYEFYSDGTYIFYNHGVNECVFVDKQNPSKIELYEEGRWELEKNKITLTVEHITYLTEGAKAVPKIDCLTKEERIRAKTEKVSVSKTKFFNVRDWNCKENIYSCYIFSRENSVKYYRTNTGFKEYIVDEKGILREPLYFDKYKIILPEGWGWKEIKEGFWTDSGPGTYCYEKKSPTESNPNPRKCKYVRLINLGNNCLLGCDYIKITDSDEYTAKGGGGVPVTLDIVNWGPENHKSTFEVVWLGKWPENKNPEPEKMLNNQGKPILYFIKGCFEKNLCLIYNAGISEDNKTPWNYEEAKNLINNIKISLIKNQ